MMRPRIEPPSGGDLAVSTEGISMKQVVIVSCLFLFSLSALLLGEEPLQRPKGLEPGDTIMLIAPSRWVSEEKVELAKRRLKDAGYRVVVQENITDRDKYLAGDDQRRAAELMAAFQNPEVDAVFPVSGGYGMTRLLDRLDFELIRKNPKVVIGYSDITPLHLALQSHAGLISFHSPNAESGPSRPEGMNPFAASYFWPLIQRGDDPLKVYRASPELGPLKILREGKAEGVLTGGNLTLISTLMGTPYELETDQRVVVIEDVTEAPYRIDRYLSQLKLAGKLERPAAVLLGQFTDCDPEDPAAEKSLEEIFTEYFGDAPYPVVMNFPVGHVPQNAAMPLGCRVEVDTAAGTVRLLERPTR